MNQPQADIGVVGLAVMGENLILNMEDKGFTVACYNRTVEKVDAFVNASKGQRRESRNSKFGIAIGIAIGTE